MRYLYAGFEEDFPTFLEARRALRRAVARREVLRKSAGIVVMGDGRYRVAGDAIVGPWALRRKASGGPWREVLHGRPVMPPRPKHRKGKRAKHLYIKGPMFPHP